GVSSHGPAGGGHGSALRAGLCGARVYGDLSRPERGTAAAHTWCAGDSPLCRPLLVALSACGPSVGSALDLLYSHAERSPGLGPSEVACTAGGRLAWQSVYLALCPNIRDLAPRWCAHPGLAQ